MMNKKWFQLILCLVLAVSVLTCTALAAGLTSTDVVAGDGVTCTIEGDKVTDITVTCNTDLMAGKEYVLMVVKTDLKADTPDALLNAVKTTSGAWDVGTDTILYIDQIADASGVKFENFQPKGITNSVILLGGEFANGVQSPKVLGVIKGNGVDVTGKVTSYKPTAGATVALYAATGEAHNTATETPIYPAVSTSHADAGTGVATQDFTIHGVAAGTYDLVVTKPGHVSYTVTGVTVSDATDVGTLAMICGDVTGNDSVNFDDLSVIVSIDNYDKLTSESGVNAVADLDGNGSVNFDDLSILLNTDNYDKAAVKVAYAAK